MTSIYKAISELEDKGQTAVLCTIIESKGSTPRHQNSKMLVYSNGQIIGSVGGGEIEGRVIKEALLTLKDAKSKLLHYKLNNPEDGDPGICGGQVQVYLEPLGTRERMIIIGAGHVGKAVAKIAKWLGFRVVVSDDRAEFCNPEFIPDADEYIVLRMSEIPDALHITNRDYLVLTTRGSDIDIAGLPDILKITPKYIGIIGSIRRWLHTREKLIERGVSKELIKQIHSPIGLELQAETPEEIAISIMAEIIMLRNNGSGKLMQYQGDKN